VSIRHLILTDNSKPTIIHKEDESINNKKAEIIEKDMTIIETGKE
tara:strand:- start:326 stop:460 length:135 start_codon:yes stop_codon:yes gene_type:complete